MSSAMGSSITQYRSSNVPIEELTIRLHSLAPSNNAMRLRLCIWQGINYSQTPTNIGLSGNTAIVLMLSQWSIFKMDYRQWVAQAIGQCSTLVIAISYDRLSSIS